MADRYWVGGTGSWTQTGTANWSASSGGAPGASTPTAADNVIFDANSSAASYTVTLSGTGWQAACLNFTTGAPASGALTFNLGLVLNVSGSAYLHAGLQTQFIAGAPHFAFVGSTPCTLTTNGINLPWLILATGTSTLTLQDDLNCSINDGTLIIRQGTFDANGKNITTQQVMNNNRILLDVNEEPYYWEYSTVKFGAGVWTVTGGGGGYAWSYLNPQLVTHTLPANPADSVVRLTNSSASAATFGSPIAGFSKAFGTLEIATTGAGATIFSGNHTFAKLKVTGTARTLKFQAGKTFTFAAFECSGTAGNLNTFAPNTAGQAYSFAKSGGGVVSNDYLSLSYCNASPANTWYAGSHSTNGGSSTGWSFTDPLGAVAQAQAAASGALDTSILLAGAAAGQASTGGALTSGITLTGAAIAAVGAGGNLSAQISLDGASVALVTADGQLTAQITLAGDALAQAAAGAGLDTSILLAGGAAGRASASGALLEGAASLAGDAGASASASAVLTAQINLTGAAAALAGSAGTLTAQIALSGAALANAIATGSLAIPLLLLPDPRFEVFSTGRSFEVFSSGRSFEAAAIGRSFEVQP